MRFTNRLIWIIPILLWSLLPPPPQATADIVYVSNWNNNTVRKFDSITGQDLGVLAAVAGPRSMALDGAGNLFVVSYSNGSIIKFTQNGAQSTVAGGLLGLESLAIDKAGNMYVGNFWDDSIVKISPDGSRSVFATNDVSGPEALANPQDVEMCR